MSSSGIQSVNFWWLRSAVIFQVKEKVVSNWFFDSARATHFMEYLLNISILLYFRLAQLVFESFNKLFVRIHAASFISIIANIKKKLVSWYTAPHSGTTAVADITLNSWKMHRPENDYNNLSRYNCSLLVNENKIQNSPKLRWKWILYRFWKVPKICNNV